MEKMITCINCPVGCRMTVALSDQGEVQAVTGNTCPRGAKYAQQECMLPVRMITAVLPVAGSGLPLSVKTDAPVPKHLIQAVMKELSTLSLAAPVHAGQVVCPNILGTGVNVVATKDV